jgi:hypothetical protein
MAVVLLREGNLPPAWFAIVAACKAGADAPPAAFGGAVYVKATCVGQVDQTLGPRRGLGVIINPGVYVRDPARFCAARGKACIRVDRSTGAARRGPGNRLIAGAYVMSCGRALCGIWHHLLSGVVDQGA